MWHSHEYEVKSGVLFLPGVPGPVERKDLEKVAKHGKTIHFWQVDRDDELSLGLPQVTMALTRDGNSTRRAFDNIVLFITSNLKWWNT
ncbi:putative Oil body-associated protein [Helianthus annuus]|nr:putative Oil body-associated protein [Helianthus annuus]KAJ0588790.1 putative Oil body-associated protein [Helianthus annuus]KAJ0596957.1 putative Oil body-associated protein [Helianthus annuus]KAJ0757639.1 putative Oil body-associated protein [Helianthus annuus]KAJ0761324.1 putative Oil body-associated protein [Helianthus annuus]